MQVFFSRTQNQDLFLMACKSGNLIQVEISLKELKNEGEFYFHKFQEDQGQNCLHLATINGHLEVMKYLQTNLDSRIFTLALDAKTKNGMIYGQPLTVLEMASYHGHLEICKWLLSVDNFLLLNFELHSAASNGHLDVVKFFVSKGVDINVLSVDSGTTVLMDAVLGNHLEICKFLISQNCDLNIQSRNENVTALDIAKFNGHQEIITHLEQIM